MQFVTKLKYLIICSILFVAPLFSIPVDLSVEDTGMAFPLHLEKNEQATLEFYHFRKNTIYVLQVQGEIQLLKDSNSQFVTMGENNSVLIENEDQLSEEDVVVLTLVPMIGGSDNLEIRIEKMVVKTDEYPNLGNERWGHYIDQVRDTTEPERVSEQLITMTGESILKNVMSVGCGAGRDPLYWVDHGLDVTVLDGTPHAVAITCLRLAEKGSLAQLKGAVACMLEAIPAELGTFDAVTGSSVFPFISPNQFEEVMTKQILSHVALSGYFAGQFFGQEHEWAMNNDTMTFVSVNDLIVLLEKNGFEILWLNEVKDMQQTVFDGTVLWHEIQVVAQKHG